MSQDLLRDYPLEELPQWPHLEKLTRPVELIVGEHEYPVQVAYFTYRYTGADYLYYDKTLLVLPTDGPDQFHRLYEVSQRHSKLHEDSAIETYGTRTLSYNASRASNAEVADGLLSLKWIGQQLRQQ